WPGAASSSPDGDRAPRGSRSRLLDLLLVLDLGIDRLGLGLGLGLGSLGRLALRGRLRPPGARRILRRSNHRHLASLVLASQVSDQVQQRALALDPGQLRVLRVLEIAVVAGVSEPKLGPRPAPLVELEIGAEVLAEIGRASC